MIDEKHHNLFIIYSHRDESLLQRLEKHLVPLKEQGLISGWHDRRIEAGTEWTGQINENLESSQIVLLLVSADFLASEYCYGVELTHVLELHEEGRLRVIPILLRPCDWRSAPFANFAVLPSNGTPVIIWKNMDDAFVSIINSIRDAIQSPRESGSVDSEVPTAATSQEQRGVAVEGVGVPVVAARKDAPRFEITIDRDFDSYSEKDQARLLNAISQLLQMSGDVRIISKKQ
jgi:TIR domain